MSDNIRIGRALRAAHESWASEHGGRSRAIRLPAGTQIKFHANDQGADIEMTQAAVTANMQTNAAAFEGWALALHLWLGYRVINLRWEAPGDAASNRHYARFLYRVQRFADLFPDWFRVESSQFLDACFVKSGVDLFLNVAGKRSKEPAEPKRETKIERALVNEHRELLLKTFGLKKVDRQFPVGVYQTFKLKQPVFTGGTSAIDITGTDGKSFDVIELKAGNNITVGALGELMFYASVIRDATGSSPRFQFGHGSVGKDLIGPDDVKAASQVRGILLAEEFHPLLEHPALFSTLNGAASQQAHPVPVRFEMWRLSDFDSQSGPQLALVAPKE